MSPISKVRLVDKVAVALSLVLAAMLLAARPAHADTTFTVNSAGDRSDQVTSNGACFTGAFIRGASGRFEAECTLRAAIQEANNTVGDDTIHFDIPGSGVKSIKPSSALPNVTEQVTIDGYSQPGASPNTKAVGTNAVLLIELSGEKVTEFTPAGLFVKASNSVVRGLVINRFFRGIYLEGSGNRVEGNFVGTDPSGTQDLGNVSGGVIVASGANTVGGTSPAARNLLSGNGEGINLGGGVEVFQASGNEVLGNLIGTTRDGTGKLGNNHAGVRVVGESDNTVGGTTPAASNTIAFNGRDGIEVFGFNNTTGNRILRNSIFSNAELGIDLRGGTENASGATANDPGDADTGPNNLQNKPALSSAVTSKGATTIEGRFNSTPNKTFLVRFFSNPADEEEGKRFLGQKSVTTNSSGNVTFTFTPSQALAVGQRVTATATGGEGTSEFSAPRAVVQQ